MKLPIELPFKKKGKIEFFLALLLGEEKITAVIFQEIDGKVHVVGESDAFFSESIESVELEELLTLADEVIGKAESSLLENTETRKTVFGVKHEWVEDAKIKKEYLVKLKKISDELALAPIGFLVIPEAIAHLLQQEEGAPISAILAETGRRFVDLSIIRAGKIIDTKRFPIEDSVPKTIDSALHHFSDVEVLPARIIIFETQHSEKLSQELISHTWSKTLPFLHVPQIAVLAKRFDAKAVLSGAAAQMGFEVLHEQINQEEDQQIITEAKAKTHSKKEKKGKEEVEEETDNFGFLHEKDLGDEQEEAWKTKEGDHPGFTIHHSDASIVKEDEDNKQDVGQKSSVLPRIGVFMNKAFSPLRHLRLPTLSLPTLFHGRKVGKIVFIPPIILGLLIILILIYFFGVKSTVVLHIKPKVVEKESSITFSKETPTSIEDKTIAAEEVTVAKKGTVSTATTGTKEVGEKAKGGVTFYSRLTQERTFSEGAIITSSNGLQFVLDSSVKVASASADASAQPATAKGNVTAKGIGKEYNLPSSTRFTIASFDASDVVIKNDSAFSGGSKKEIKVVAKADTNKLLSQLSKELESDAQGELQTKTTDENEVLPTLTGTSVDEKEFDKNVGDEATTLRLSGTVSFTSLAFKKTEVKDFIKQLVTEDEKDSIFSDKGLSYSISDVKEQDETNVTAKVTMKANLLPKIDSKKVAASITGKSLTDAKSSLTQLPQVADATISLRPNIPFLPQVLPRQEENIEIQTVSNE